MEYLFSVISFSISASITPGPNTIIAMASGLNFGVRSSLPLLWGICFGFSFMLFLVGLGVGQIILLFPQLALCMKVISIVYLLYLAYAIANSGEYRKKQKYRRPLSFSKAVLFQWINAKAWIICISAVSTFTTPGNSYFAQLVILTLAFFIVGPICVGIWVFVGAFLKQKCVKSSYIKHFNLFMAFLLVLSIIPAIKGSV